MHSLSSTLSVGLVAYYPDDSFFSTIQIFINHGFRVSVYNNGITSEQKDRLYGLVLPDSGIKVLGVGSNDGLGKSISELSKYSLNEKDDYILILDQDTLITDEFLHTLNSLDVMSLFAHNYSTLQIISEMDKRYKNKVFVEEVVLNINSGSIFNLKLCSKINFHDESFFVEGVDYDFCIRSRNAGYKVGIIHGIKGLDHFSNQDGYVKKIFNKNFNVRVYPKSRVLDFYRSHTKLLMQSLRTMDFSASFIFAKHMVNFVITNIISKVITLIREKK